MSTAMLSRLLNTAIFARLILALGTTIYGHVGASACGLSLRNSYVTEYLKMAPHWPWLVVASFSFALLIFLLALALLLRSHDAVASPSIVVGCLLLAAASMGTFFVAYAPMRRVEQPPPPSHEWWTPTWWFTSQTSHTPYEQGMADAYADVHYRATRLVVSASVTAIFLLALGHLTLWDGKTFALTTVAATIAMAVLFQMGDRLPSNHGLWQRLGFALMYAWFWLAYRRCLNAEGAR